MVQILTIPDTTEAIDQSWFDMLLFGKKSRATELPIQDYKLVGDELIVKPYAELKSHQLEKSFSIKLFGETTSKEEISAQYIEETTFYLGTDKYGRDLLSRILVGVRISFFIGFIAVFISLLIGITMER